MSSITISADTSPLLECLTELNAYLNACITEGAEIPLELFKFIVQLPQLPAKFIYVESESTLASGTGESTTCVRFQPTSGFLELMLAIRAGDFDLGLLELSLVE